MGPSGRPRMDRYQDRTAGTPGPSQLADDPPRRVRRDPRTERRVARGAPGPVQAVAQSVGMIAEPHCWILAVPDLVDSRLSVADRELLGAGRRIADANRGALAVLVCATAMPDGMAEAGADRVLPAIDPRFTGYAAELRCAAAMAAVDLLAPRHVVFPDTPTNGGDTGRRLGAELDERPTAAVHTVSADFTVARGQGGASDIRRPLSRLLLLATDAFAPHDGPPHEARMLTMPPFSVDARLLDLGPVAIDANALPLAEADFIVSAGNGVTDWNAFHEVAAALHATEGGSRAVVDAGFLPRERQVGASGTLVDPRCYLAFGIAGAPQHLQGIMRCEHVIAVNTDLHADMVKRADLAIVADAQVVMPALTRLVSDARSRG